VSQSHIRNFCIIAHIDHGKSTLADRFLELTGTVEKRLLHKQYLDLMDLEQERGITIKLTPVRMEWLPTLNSPIAKGMASYQEGEATPLPPPPPQAGEGSYILNLIDTPGHVDFTYEVSRSRSACEGAIVVVDATQGIEAQTLANVYLALEQDLVLIPIVNKIDLPHAQPERVAHEMIKVFGFKDEEILFVSAKTGEGVTELMQTVIDRIPPPQGEEQQPTRALIFDSKYDSYKGAVAYVRIVDGELHQGDQIRMLGSGSSAEILELGFFKPDMKPAEKLLTGEVGYIATGMKDVLGLRVGDTITNSKIRSPRSEILDQKSEIPALPGYKQIQPKVFSGIYPIDGNDYHALREAMERLALNDASLQYEPETSSALGFGFRCGFLGLLHIDIIQERLEREYNLNLIFTAPNVEYKVLVQGEAAHRIVHNPSEFPESMKIEEVLEPWVKMTILTPASYMGSVMDLVQKHRGVFGPTDYIDSERVTLHFELPLSEVIVKFYDQLKSISQGYASMDYEPIGDRSGNLEKLVVMVHGDPVDAFASIVPRVTARYVAEALVKKLKEIIPRQMFEVRIQALLGGKIISSAHISAMRKDVIAKLYGGDRTRKDKLLKKQKKGKKRMKMFGKVEIPQEAFQAIVNVEQ
jgi:GTP-binding protein LepA